MDPSTPPEHSHNTVRWLIPDLILHPSQGWLSGHALGINRDGFIDALIPTQDLTDNAHRERLPGRALLPGFVNAHSHAFQRAMRGAAECVPPHTHNDNFWAWRTHMYTLAQTLTPDRVYAIACSLYKECLAAGYTTVGEFHYIHHKQDGSVYTPPTAMSDALIQAAQDTGIRLTLLIGLYQTGGIATPPSTKQQRFIFSSFERYIRFVESLKRRSAHIQTVSIGLAPHSIRAVPREILCELAQWNAETQCPVHIHACEQIGEIEQSFRAYGIGPIEVLEQAELLNARLTIVHATHLQTGDTQRLSRTGARVCVCPTTEANLGDGWLPSEELMRARVPMCIGSDSHIIVNPFEELRWIELEARLQRRERNVLLRALHESSGETEPNSLGCMLLEIGSKQGAQALHLPTGSLERKKSADLLSIDLASPLLKYTERGTLSDALVFGADPRCIREIYVQGRQV